MDAPPGPDWLNGRGVPHAGGDPSGRSRPSMGGVAWLVGFIGLVLIGVSALWLMSTESRTSMAQGEVIGVVSSTDADGTTYASVVGFQAGDTRVEFQDNVFTNVNPKQVGDLVDVVYDPANPTSAGITSGLRVLLMQVGIGALGLTGLVMLVAALRYR